MTANKAGHTPSTGAMRAAEAIRQLCLQQAGYLNAVLTAEIIDRETGAPEILEALEALIDSARDGRHIPEWLDERLVLVEAAIRKARGDV